MRNFLQNWNYNKHAASVTSIFLGFAILGNAFFGKKIAEDEKTLCPITVCKQMTKKQWAFNGILAGAYLVKMSAGYVIVNHWKKQYK